MLGGHLHAAHCISEMGADLASAGGGLGYVRIGRPARSWLGRLGLGLHQIHGWPAGWVDYCKRFAQSAGPWFGHRFAQSAGPRPPLRSVRCSMEICCVSQPLCHPFQFLCELRTLFDTVFQTSRMAPRKPPLAHALFKQETAV